MIIKVERALHEKNNFYLSKTCEKDWKYHIFLSFCMFPFHGNFFYVLYFLNFPSNENIRKQHHPAHAYACVNMKFLYTVAGRKDEIFYAILYQKKTIFHQHLGKIFVGYI